MPYARGLLGGWCLNATFSLAVGAFVFDDTGSLTPRGLLGGWCLNAPFSLAVGALVFDDTGSLTPRGLLGGWCLALPGQNQVSPPAYPLAAYYSAG